MGETVTVRDARGLGLLDRLQPVVLLGAIAVGLALAGLAPRTAAAAGPLVEIGVFLVIFLVMLGVRTGEVLAAFKRWRPTGLALAINFLFTPLFAWFLGWLFLQSHPEVWVGLILYLVTPCIGWYLVFTDLAGGDVELGLSLLVWNVLLQILLLPVYLWVLAGRIVTLDPAVLLQSVVLFLVLPLVLAELAKRAWRRSGRVEPIGERLPLGLFKTATLALVIAAMFASQGRVLFDNPSVVAWMILPGLVFFVAIFAVALAAAKLARLTYPETALLAMTTAARNSEASLAIAVGAFASPLVALTVVIGPAFELPVLVAMVQLLGRVRGRGWYPEPSAEAGAARGRGVGSAAARRAAPSAGR